MTTSSRSSRAASARSAVRGRLLDRLQPEQDRGERLPRLVVQLAREPAALELLRRDDAAERVALDARREVGGDRRPGRERLRDPQVGVGEARVGAELVVDRDHADRAVAGEQRHVEAGRRAHPARGVLVGLGVVDQRVDALAAAPLQDAPGLRQRRERQTHEPVGALAVGGLDPQRRPSASAARSRRAARPAARAAGWRRAAAAAAGRARWRARSRPRSATRAGATSASPTRTAGRSRSRRRPARRAAGRGPRPPR